MDKLKFAEDLSHPDSSIDISYSTDTLLFYAELFVFGMSTCEGSGESPEAALAELLENYDQG